MSKKHEKKYKSFKKFYPVYLSERSHPLNRLLHVLGTLGAIIWLVLFMRTFIWWYLAIALLNGYAFAWIGHFLIEKNRPATFQYPLYSFMGDWVMFFEIITFRRSLKK